MITVKKLVKRFGPKVVLRGLDFEVESGEFVALLGPNGAGKTTFLRILASLSRLPLGPLPREVPGRFRRLRPLVRRHASMLPAGRRNRLLLNTL